LSDRQFSCGTSVTKDAVCSSLGETHHRAAKLHDSPVLAKKLRLSDNPAAGRLSNKQSSLLTFFGKRSRPDSTRLSRSEQRKTDDHLSQELTSDAGSSDVACKWKNDGRLSQELTGDVIASKWENSDQLSQEHMGNVVATDIASKWKTLLQGPPLAPLCKGHSQPCILRTVKKEGPNKGRQFWVCCKPEGPKNHPEARCDHFIWVSSKKS